MHPLMNNTKWEELRQAMANLTDISPEWRTKDLCGYISEWDRDWIYHFKLSGYDSIEWAEIRVMSSVQESKVSQALHRVHVPGIRIPHGYRVYGFSTPGMDVQYI